MPYEDVIELPAGIDYATQIFGSSTSPVLQNIAPPESVFQEISGIVQDPMTYVSNIGRGAVADLAAGLYGIGGGLDYAAKFSGNIPAAITGAPMPVDVALSEASKEAPVAATVGKISQGVAGMLPYTALGLAPKSIQYGLAAGFTSQMIAQAPEIATELGTEMGKPRDQWDMDKVTSLISDAAQTVGFTALAGIGAKRGAQKAFKAMEQAYVPTGLGIETPTPRFPLPATIQPTEKGLDYALEQKNRELYERMRPRYETEQTRTEMPVERSGETYGERGSETRLEEKAQVPLKEEKPVTDPKQVAEQLGVRYDGTAEGWNLFTLYDRQGRSSTTITVKADAPISEVIKKYNQKIEDYGDTPNAPRPIRKLPLTAESVIARERGTTSPEEIESMSRDQFKKLVDKKDETRGGYAWRLTEDATKWAMKQKPEDVPDLVESLKKSQESEFQKNMAEIESGNFNVADKSQWYGDAIHALLKDDVGRSNIANFKETTAKQLPLPEPPPKAPAVDESMLESVTPLEPSTGVPLSATDALINKLEALKFPEQGIPAEGVSEFYSGLKLPHPDEIKAIGKDIWNSAVNAAVKAIRAGRPIMEAIQAAIHYIRQNFPGFSEEKVRNNIQSQLTGKASTTPADSMPESDRPHPTVSPTATAFHDIRDAIHKASVTVKGMGGQSMPRITDANRAVGEDGVRYASSRIMAEPQAAIFSANTLEGTNVDPAKLGAALVEDNLASIRSKFREQSKELVKEGKTDEAIAANAAAEKVTSIIGAKDSPFKTQKEYQEFLADPNTQSAIKNHIQQWNEIVEPMYKEAMSLDPDLELPSRGLQTGARINLKAVFPEEESPAVKPVGGIGAPSLTATFKRKSPFGVEAKGTGEVYETYYPALMSNTFARQLEIANKNAFDKQLVDAGLAKIEKPGQRVLIEGKPGVPFPLTRKTRIIKTASGKTIGIGESANIYVRSDLAPEYRRASNVDARATIPGLTPVLNQLNKTALAGLTDFTVHSSNLMTALFNRPTSGKLLADSLLSATGRADIPVSIVKAILKAGQDNRAQIAELAEIGALRPSEARTGMFATSGRILRSMDTTVRLVLDDTFKQLAKDGIVEDTPTNRREFINQVGQYNRRLQGPLMRLLRDTGFGPFATAGRTFNAMGIRMVGLDPGMTAANNYAAGALRANVLSKWVGAAVLVGTLNYLTTKSVTGRPGTPLGKWDTGMDDKNKKPLQLPLFDLIGLGRGLRVTGIRGAVESKRLGLTDTDALDTAARDILNSAIGPAAGPGVRFATISASGYPPAVKVGRAAPVAPPGKSQFGVNVTEALKEANPVVATYFDWREGKSTPEILARQLPRFTLSPGKLPSLVGNYPRAVSMAQTYAFADDLTVRARKKPPGERRQFVADEIKGMTPEQKTMVLRILRQKRVIR